MSITAHPCPYYNDNCPRCIPNPPSPIEELMETLANKSYFDEKNRHNHVTEATAALLGYIDSVITSMKVSRPGGLEMAHETELLELFKKSLRERFGIKR